MNRLKKLRNKAGLSQNKLVSSFNNYLAKNNVKGITVATYSRWENSNNSPTKEMWNHLAGYFNVSVPYIRKDIDKELIAKIIKLLLNFIDPSMDFLIDGKAVTENEKALYEEMLLITLINELGLNTEQIVEELKQEMWKSEFIKVLSEYGSEDTIKGGIKLVKLYDKL